MANTSILAAFERMWQHVVNALGSKADISSVTSVQTTANAAMPKSGGTFTGAVTAANDTAYTTYKVRNAAIVSSTPSSMTNGTIAFVYS